MHVYVCGCMHVYVCGCMHVYVCGCMHVYVCVHIAQDAGFTYSCMTTWGGGLGVRGGRIVVPWDLLVLWCNL